MIRNIVESLYGLVNKESQEVTPVRKPSKT